MYLEVWRWGIFLAGVAPVYWLSEAAVHAVSVLLESQLFSAHNAMLMAMAVSIRVRLGSAPCSYTWRMHAFYYMLRLVCITPEPGYIVQVVSVLRASLSCHTVPASQALVRDAQPGSSLGVSARAEAGITPHPRRAAHLAVCRQLPGWHRAPGARAGMHVNQTCKWHFLHVPTLLLCTCWAKWSTACT